MQPVAPGWGWGWGGQLGKQLGKRHREEGGFLF